MVGIVRGLIRRGIMKVFIHHEEKEGTVTQLRTEVLRIGDERVSEIAERARRKMKLPDGIWKLLRDNILLDGKKMAVEEIRDGEFLELYSLGSGV